jgi:hypothetical protein
METGKSKYRSVGGFRPTFDWESESKEEVKAGGLYKLRSACESARFGFGFNPFEACETNLNVISWFSQSLLSNGSTCAAASGWAPR